MSESLPPHLKSCTQCGAELPAEGTNGLCPACLMGEAMQPTIVSDASKPKTHSAILAPEDLAPLFPQYEILRMLGRGGMGAVYLARQISLNRLVAIKILPADLGESDQGFAERFKNEAQAMAQLSHPGIVAVYDFGQTTNGLLFIVMEYIEGTDVQLMLASQGRLHSAHAMAITAHVCDALQYAHSCGIIHRDIKPSNIMVGNNGVVKVADFGLAKMSQGQTTGLTQSGMAMGTPHFMAPEALTLGSAVDQRADIYAVGVMLYQMLTGKLPQGMFEMPSFQVPGLDPRYDRIVAKALRDDREQRYQAALDLRHDLDAILTQPVEKVAPEAEEVKALPPVEERGRKKARVPRLPPPQAASPASARKKPVGLLLAVLGVVAAIAAAFVYFHNHGAGSTTQPEQATKEQPFVNSLGMKFVPVPITGGPTDGQRVLFSTWVTRVQDYEVFAKESGRLWPKAGFEQGPTHPAININWEDAQAFCAWITERERKAGRLGAGEVYRLPSDHEWSCAVGLGKYEDPRKPPPEKHGQIQGVYPWGTRLPPPDRVGNLADTAYHEQFPNEKWLEGYTDGYAWTSPVGSFPANEHGLYDMSGNVWQWCEDFMDASKNRRVMRGCSFSDRPFISSNRKSDPATTRFDHGDFGFRIVLAPAVVTAASSPAIATKEAPFMNTLGMKFVPVPGTKVLFCIHETRYKDYAAYAAEVTEVDSAWKNQMFDGHALTERAEDHPVLNVSWEDAQAFCAWLSKKEGKTYRLPTDEEWSIAVGLEGKEKHGQNITPTMLSGKESTEFPWDGDFPPKTKDQAGNYSDASRKAKAPRGDAQYLEDYDDGFPTTAPVMSYQPNKLGLYDLGGNVWEWCEDWNDNAQKDRVLRGGSWSNYDRGHLLSSGRGHTFPGNRLSNNGLRVVLETSAQVASPSPSLTDSKSSTSTATKDSPFINTLGMKFVPVPIGGGPTAGERVLFSVWDTRVQDYLAFARANNKVDGRWQEQQKDGVPAGRELDHPVVGVNWEDAQAFCQWLTAKETAEGKLPPGMKYRLPSDEEWSWAVGLPSEPGATPAEKRGKNGADFPWGIGFLQTGKEGNYSDEAYHAKFLNLKKGWFVGYNDGHATTSPVGSFPANAYGLYDMGGNVWQWCEDWFDKDQKERVLRGGSWGCGGRLDLLSSSRKNCEPGIRGFDNGFRCVLTAAVDTAAPSPSLPVSTSAATPANKDAPFINTLGMQFVPVPGTKTLFCIHETRRQDYAAYAAVVSGLDRSWMSQQDNGVACGDKDNHPVVGVSWKDAQAFCKWLSGKEGVIYRLPTDEEWSWAAGIGQEEQRTQGTTPAMLGQLLKTEFSWGTAWPPPEGAGNYCDASRKAAAPGEVRSIEGYDDGFPTTAPVMSYKPNNLGLYDMGGNVWEYCEDWYDNEKYERVVRGGSWFDGARGDLHLSRRGRRDPGARFNDRGFRLVLVPPPSAVVPPMPTTTNPSAVTKEAPFTNTLGMKFVPVPGTKTLMCIHETRRGDYAAYAKESPDVDPLWMNPTKDGIPVANKDDQPVSNVSWTDAQAFCAWLRRKEGRTYRLPTDREWSSAVGIGDLEREGATPKDLNSGIKDVHPWGSVWPPGQGAGNYADTLAAGKFSSLPTITAYADGHAGLAPVMSYPPNKLGIHDLGGNVWEWCEDWYDATQTDRLRRGGSYIDSMRDVLLSSKRMHTTPHERQSSEGFRCVIELPAP